MGEVVFTSGKVLFELVRDAFNKHLLPVLAHKEDFFGKCLCKYKYEFQAVRSRLKSIQGYIDALLKAKCLLPYLPSV